MGSHNKGNGKAIAWVREHAAHQGDECLVWPFCRDGKNGRGRIGYLGKQTWAHRFMCEFVYGPAPSPEHEAAHSCGKGHEGCVNPKHLEWKTKSDNQRDRAKHGTKARATWGMRGKLTPEEVAAIRVLKGRTTQDAIAKLFGVTDTTIRDIFSGRSRRAVLKFQPFTEAEDNVITDWLAAGRTLDHLAVELKRSYGSIHGRAKRLGLLRRDVA
jgi:hypothetical protein